jgi:hypothetical protein
MRAIKILMMSLTLAASVVAGTAAAAPAASNAPSATRWCC